MPERTTKAAVLVGLAPHGADGLDWFDGMAQSNVLEFTAAANGYEGIAAHTRATGDAIRANPASLIATLQAELPDPDPRVVAYSGIRSKRSRAMPKPCGHLTTAGSMTCWRSVPLGTEPAAVTVPVLVWHGASDDFSPASQLGGWQTVTSAAVVVRQAPPTRRA